MDKFPPGRDEARVRRVLEHYEIQTEDEAASEDHTQTVMEIPTELVPAVREPIAQRKRRPLNQFDSSAVVPLNGTKVERLGYFALDADSKPGKPVFNRTITLKDTWAKEVRKG